MVGGLDRGGGDGRRAENNHLQTKPFGVSKTLSFFDNPGLESTTPETRRKPNSDDIESPGTKPPTFEDPEVLSPQRKVQVQVEHPVDELRGAVRPVDKVGHYSRPELKSLQADGRRTGSNRASLFICPPCAPRSLLYNNPTNPITPRCIQNNLLINPQCFQSGAKSLTLPRSWTSHNYILVQKESLRDEDLVWL